MARYPRSDHIHNDYHNYTPHSEHSTEGLVYQIAAITRESMREGPQSFALKTRCLIRPTISILVALSSTTGVVDDSSFRPDAMHRREAREDQAFRAPFSWKGKDNEEVCCNPSPERISMEPEATSRSVEQMVTTGIINPQEPQINSAPSIHSENSDTVLLATAKLTLADSFFGDDGDEDIDMGEGYNKATLVEEENGSLMTVDIVGPSSASVHTV
ncbi:hypothetical protein M422DRAFT_273622 [Sphaerobolus stellatus SS14]|uniref:Uncharacterized protein n=1 Tax=Sphaerobolus stellatus (strain SS14) TaxID=990650 RepID=A0A0C9TUE8_SPHS4|nr:hypothetical protein M422DRAFT_273622 [Sphaerobolus stellatus SS14]